LHEKAFKTECIRQQTQPKAMAVKTGKLCPGSAQILRPLGNLNTGQFPLCPDNSKGVLD
jgi:hypothetical protein